VHDDRLEQAVPTPLSADDRGQAVSEECKHAQYLSPIT
jgi:hypothetical protein